MSEISNTLNNLGMSALGMAMPVLSPTWTSGTMPASAPANLALTLSSGWLSPLAAVATKIGDTADLRVTLIGASGTPIRAPGLLLTVTPQLYLRLRRLYARVIETPATTAEPAASYPVRPVPRYFFYAGAGGESEQDGVFDPQEPLGRGGSLTIHDADGMPIDPLAVAGAFAAILRGHQILEYHANLADGFAEPQQLLDIADLGGEAAVHVRISDFAGRPYGGDHLQTLGRPTGGAPGVFSVTAGATIGKEPATAADGAFPPDKRDRLLIGPATTGALGDQLTLPATVASTADMPRDFFSLRVIELEPYLIGARSSSWIGTRLERPPAVRIHESLSLLADGNQVLGAAHAALDGAEQPMCVAQAISDDFLVPPSADAAASHWPAFPAGGATDAGVALPVHLEGFAATAQYLVEEGHTYGDVILTLTGLPANAAVRVYHRRFLPDAREGRGDGAGGVASDDGEITLRLEDPLALQSVRPPERREVTLPSPGTLHLDMVVVRRNAARNARVYGNVVVTIPADSRTSAVPPAPAVNGFAADGVRRGVCNAGILGLGAQRNWNELLAMEPEAAARALLGEGNPRDQSRLPLMARREVLVSGRVDGSWRACLSAGRLTAEALSGDQRLGAPGGRGGRETQTVGVATEGGLLAYDLARMALRRTLNVAERLVPLVESTYTEPVTPTTGRFAAAALQTVAPFCETPELGLLRGLLSDPSTVPATLTDLIRVVGDWITREVSSTELTNLWNRIRTTPVTEPVANRIYDELRRELVSSCFGRRDTQWALKDAIDRARRFIYIETPGFCATQGSTARDWSADLIGALSTRIAAAPGLHVIVCLPRHPDVATVRDGGETTARAPADATGYEPMAAYELTNRFDVLEALQLAGAGDEMKSRVVPFHPVGFPGRPTRLEGTVVIVDDVWALVGASSFRRRGLTFDGSADVVLTDTLIEEGRSPAIRDFRRRLMAMRLGAAEIAAAGTRDTTYARLYDGVEAFYAVAEMLIAGGAGKIERLWSGEIPGQPAPTPANIAIADPEGQEFDGNLLTVLGTQLAALFANAADYPYA